MADLYGLGNLDGDKQTNAEKWLVERINGALRSDGYRLIGSFASGSQHATSVAGFRLVRSNAWGDYLWIDDLVAGGLAANAEVLSLLRFIQAEAERMDISQIHLDVIPEDEPPTTVGVEQLLDLDMPPTPRGPVGDRLRAASFGFHAVAQRFVLNIESSTDDSGGRVEHRRALGRPSRPRRGH